MRALVCVCACAIHILGLTSCQPDEPYSSDVVRMPVSICLPVSDVYNPQNAPELRAFGDPGTTEQFALPLYIYFFIVKQTVDDDDDSWKVSDVIVKSYVDEEGSTVEQKLEAWNAKWERVRNTGLYSTYYRDEVFHFKEELEIPLEATRYNGRVYAIASAIQLNFTPDISDIVKGTSLDDLLSLTFQFDGNQAYDDMVKDNLQNIYSTPYNYNYDYGSGSDYYGSFSKNAKVPHLDLLLYHVAAKVDLMWNVKEEIRSEVKINHVEVMHLYDGPCKVFKPTENQVAALTYSPGYNMVVLDNLSPGTQWNGRGYFYAIPYKNNDTPTPHYPLQLKLLKAEETPSGGYYSTIEYTSIPNNVWTSWIRGQISINTATYNVTP